MSRSSIFERNPKTSILLVIVISTLILDVFLTNAFSLYTKIKNNEPNILTRPPIMGVKHDIYHHTWAKNFSIETEYPLYHDEKIKLYSNSLGFKDESSRTVSIVPKEGIEKRIVFIGDSFTQGAMLNYKDTFVGVIDSELKESIEVLNAGVGANSPIIYWRKTKHLIEEVGLKFDELVVELDLSDVNDEITLYTLSENDTVVSRETKVDNEYGVGFVARLKHLIKNNSTLFYHFINTLHDAINPNAQENYLWDKRRSEMGDWYLLLSSLDGIGMWTINEKLYTEWGEKGILEMIKYMDKLLRLTQKNNIKLTVGVHPWPNQVWHEDLNSLHVKIWKDWCHSNNVKFINYFPDFISKGLNNKEKKRVLEKYYLRGDVHFNKQGNALIAKRFLEKYSQDGSLAKN